MTKYKLKKEVVEMLQLAIVLTVAVVLVIHFTMNIEKVNVMESENDEVMDVVVKGNE